MIAENRTNRLEPLPSYGTRLDPEALHGDESPSEPGEALLRSLQAWRSLQPHPAPTSARASDVTLEVPVI
jgi:hypothetical protein